MNAHEKIGVALDGYFRQLHQYGERFQEQLRSLNDAYAPLRDSLVQSAEQLQKALAPLVEQQERFRQTISLLALQIPEQLNLSPIAKQLRDFQTALRASIGPAVEQFRKGFEEQPARVQEALLLLGKHGWYFDPEMPLTALWELNRALSEGDVIEAESALVAYFDSNLDEIQAAVTKSFPNRSHLIRDAFNAHRRGEYALSIPVLLAQTDGICKECVNEYLFLKQDKKPRTALYVAQIAADTFEVALLAPLAHSLPIGASEYERQAGFDALNRHMVLHGESLDYGNKINSLKTISLINYVAHALRPDNDG